MLPTINANDDVGPSPGQAERSQTGQSFLRTWDNGCWLFECDALFGLYGALASWSVCCWCPVYTLNKNYFEQ